MTTLLITLQVVYCTCSNTAHPPTPVAPKPLHLSAASRPDAYRIHCSCLPVIPTLINCHTIIPHHPGGQSPCAPYLFPTWLQSPWRLKVAHFIIRSPHPSISYWEDMADNCLCSGHCRCYLIPSTDSNEIGKMPLSCLNYPTCVSPAALCESSVASL